MNLTKDTLIEGMIVKKGTRIKVKEANSNNITYNLSLISSIIKKDDEGADFNEEETTFLYENKGIKYLLEEGNYFEFASSYFDSEGAVLVDEVEYLAEYLPFDQLSKRNLEEVKFKIDRNLGHFLIGILDIPPTRSLYVYNLSKLEDFISPYIEQEMKEEKIIDQTYEEVELKIEKDMKLLMEEAKTRGYYLEYNIENTGDSLYLEVFCEETNETVKIRFSDHTRISSNYNIPQQNINIFSYVKNKTYSYLAKTDFSGHLEMELDDYFDFDLLFSDLGIDN